MADNKVFTKVFRTGYLFTMGILTLGILIVLIILWVSLDGYEKSTPENIANRVFSKYFKELNAKNLYARGLPLLSEFETLGNFEARFAEIAGKGERGIRIVQSEMEDRKKFVVFSEDGIFAEFEVTLKSNAKNPVWELSNISMALGELKSFDVIVTAGSDIYINGKSAGKNLITESGPGGSLEGAYDKYTIDGFISEPIIEAKPRGGTRNKLNYYGATNQYSNMRIVTADILEGSRLYINGITVQDNYIVEDGITTPETDRLKLSYNRYCVATDYSAKEPDIRVVNKDGKDGVLKDGGNYTLTQEIIYDADLQNEYENFVKDAAMIYVRYMSNNVRLSQTRSHFETGTELYEIMRLSEVYFYTPYIGYKFENVTASEFYKRDEDEFSCRITLDHYVVRNVATTAEVEDLIRADVIELTADIPTYLRTYHFPLDVTLFLRKVGGQYLVYNLSPNE